MRNLLSQKLPAILCVLAFAAGSLLAEPPSDWSKVKDLATGSDLRVYRNGLSKPIGAKMGDVLEDKLILLLKDEQISVAREEIDRIDWRSGKAKVRKETKTSTEAGKVPGSGVPELPGRTASGPSGNSSTSLTFAGKGEFETVYMRRK